MSNKKISKTTLTFLVLFILSCGQQYEFGLPETSNEFLSKVVINNKVDVVFIVDDSESMGQAQKSLSSTIPDMIAYLLTMRLDLNVVVISTSMGGSQYTGGRFIGSPKVLSNSTSGFSSILATRLNLGTQGRDVERGISSLLSVLSDSYLNGDGRGFLRKEALLAVIALTNEDDQSAQSVDDVIRSLDQLKGHFDNGDRAWTLNLIGTLSNSGTCETNTENGYIERSDKYIELAQKSKGVTESICSTNLVPAVRNIKSRIIQVLTDYKLDRVPNIASIQVFANNVLVPRSNLNGWDYIADGNLIRFYGTYIPAADVMVRVDFLPAGAD